MAKNFFLLKGEEKVKKVLIVAMMLAFATTAFAINFQPTQLKLDAQDTIVWDFNGSLNFNVTTTGTASQALFLVFTKDLAATMPTVVNGYLGWHTVNKVDTCIYVSAPMTFSIGSNPVTWSGADNDGKDVAAGTYTYYVWAFDNVGGKVFAAPLRIAQMTTNTEWVTRDTAGIALAQPYLVDSNQGLPTAEPAAGSAQALMGLPVTTANGGGDAEGTGYRQKWYLGTDPGTSAAPNWGAMEWSKYNTFLEMADYVRSPIAGEDDMFFQLTCENSLQGHIRKWQWVPNGSAVQDMSFGDGGEFVYSINAGTGYWVMMQAMSYVGGELLGATNTDHQGISTEAELVLVDINDGEEAGRINLAEWWIDIEDGEKGGQQASGPNKMDVVDNMYVFLDAHSSCANQMIVPTAGDDPGDFNRWVNLNGDYTGDHNFEEDSEKPWVCHDYNVGPYKYQIMSDSNLFSAFPCFDMGAVSFGLYAPDGTGLNYFAYTGETAGGKRCTGFLDDDTPFDGIYVDAVSSLGMDSPWGGPANQWFVAHDSIKGVITNGVSVAEDAPAAFAVAQNSPNPFNPTTTISFTIADAGNVSIDVFNVAGQKVDTIASDFMSAGSHTATWDASGFSAGVYFYTVKAGDISKTMKMTLVK